MGDRTARENVTSNSCLKIFVRTLQYYKWEISITVRDNWLIPWKKSKDNALGYMF